MQKIQETERQVVKEGMFINRKQKRHEPRMLKTPEENRLQTRREEITQRGDEHTNHRTEIQTEQIR